MKAAIYARYSSEMQRAASIEDQGRNCRRRAEVEGWEIVATFADAAISGSDSRRPQYLKMLEAAAQREFDVLLVDDLSRLTRDSVEQERAIRRMEFQGLRIIGVSDGYDSNSKARKVHRGVKGLMNELFLDDLRDKTHRGIEGQARKGFWTGGRPYGYRLRPITDASKHDQYGQPARIGTKIEIDPEQAEVVREIYQRFADGQSTRSIAAELNRLNIPSPGSTWNRRTRRCASWMGSAIRVITRAPIYGGLVRWNANAYIKDPDSGIHKRRARPRSEWLEYRDESLRIVSDELIERARNRTQSRTSDDQRLRSGGKAKFLLSGLLECGSCHHRFVMANGTSYACSTHLDGKACSNGILVRRDHMEATLLGPIRKGLLSPERVARMAEEMQQMLAKRAREIAGHATQRPRELAELDARIARLHERQRTGDPDLTADELQSAIDRALEKRRQLEAAQPEVKQSASILAALPKAAALYRQQIELGLDGDPRAALKARVILRQLFGGKIVLQPGPDQSLWAEYALQPSALVRIGTGGGPCRDRTYDQEIKSLLLYQLS
jgi:site-specific DNA recombinase